MQVLRKALKILVSGASGFIGTALVAFFQQKGWDVAALSRREGSLCHWDSDRLDRGRQEDLEGYDAVVHLAGEPLTLSRWTQSKRDRIFSSRAKGTASLCHALARLRRPPSVFVSASAVGFYGDRGEELLTESSGEGRGFLAHVCAEWERGSKAIEDRGARVVNARFGIVLGSGGGVLQKMIPWFQMGMGARMASGKQWLSWIALSDLIHALEYLLRKDFQGPVNIASPCPVRQEEFCKILSGLLHRPAILSLPAWLLRALLGLAAEEMLLSSQRVEPAKLLASGFSFRYPSIEEALKRALLTK